MTNDRMIEMVAESYITVYGKEKWQTLSDQEKHDAIMFIVKDLINRL